jgi:Xaa-Pro aminopeptidase
MSIQNFGETFSLEKLMRAREVARNLTYELSVLIQPGMIESEALEIYEQLCLKYSIHKQWHQPKIRFGPNTTKNFSEPSESYILKEEDLFLIDIGPVIDGH